MEMDIKVMLCLALMAIVTSTIASAQGGEPTWLFTVPKAETLKEGDYNLGFLYADFGLVENLELGIHGLKYSLPESNIAFGASIFPMGSPYLVSSLGMGPGKLHLGIKTAPYVFFAGFETPVSDKVKFVAELTNGVSAGVRIFPAENWTLDIFAAFITLDVYRYEYEFKNFYPIPGILFAYSGSL